MRKLPTKPPSINWQPLFQKVVKNIYIYICVCARWNALKCIKTWFSPHSCITRNNNQLDLKCVSREGNRLRRIYDKTCIFMYKLYIVWMSTINLKWKRLFTMASVYSRIESIRLSFSLSLSRSFRFLSILFNE